MKLSILAISILLFVSCVSTPVAVTEVVPEVSVSATVAAPVVVEYTHTYTYNIVAFTGDTSTFQYPVEIVNFFIDNFKSIYNVSNVTLLTGANATFDKLKAVVEPYRNVANVVNIILYSGHGNMYGFNAYADIQYRNFIQYFDTFVTPTIILVDSCHSGNLSRFLKPNTNLTVITGSAPDTTTSSGGDGGVQLNMLASIIYALQTGIELDTDKDGDISILEVVSEAVTITEHNISTYGKGWARFGVFLWGEDDRVVATY